MLVVGFEFEFVVVSGFKLRIGAGGGFTPLFTAVNFGKDRVVTGGPLGSVWR